MNEHSPNYFETEAGQFIANAHRYLSAAKTLTETQDWIERYRLLQTPVLHLLCHGIELFLKYPLLRQGATQLEVTKSYGHDLTKLWNANGNALAQKYVFQTAQMAWEYAKNSNIYPNDDFSEDPDLTLVRALEMLAHLHGRPSAFALRYTISEPMDAPRPRFLIEVFANLAERTCMNPSYLDD